MDIESESTQHIPHDDVSKEPKSEQSDLERELKQECSKIEKLMADLSLKEHTLS